MAYRKNGLTLMINEIYGTRTKNKHYIEVVMDRDAPEDVLFHTEDRNVYLQFMWHRYSFIYIE